MSSPAAVVSEPEQNSANPESDANKAGASKLAVRWGTRRFIQLEIGIKKTRSSSGCAVGKQPQQKPPNVPRQLTAVGGPRPPEPVADTAAPVPGNSESLDSTGSGLSTSTSAVYINLSAGDTSTPPDSGDGLIKP